MIRVQCALCGTSISGDSVHAGKHVKCPKCSSPVLLRQTDGGVPAPPVAQANADSPGCTTSGTILWLTAILFTYFTWHWPISLLFCLAFVLWRGCKTSES